MSPLSVADSNLAPPEVWDIVNVLSNKLKKTREELEGVRAENEQLRDIGRGGSSVTEKGECLLGACASADKVEKLQNALMVAEEERDHRALQIIELRRQVSELQSEAKQAFDATQVETERMDTDAVEYRPPSPVESTTVVSDDGLAVHVVVHQPAGMPKPSLAQSDFSVLPRPTLPDWSSLEPCFHAGPKFELSIPADIMNDSQCKESIYCRQTLVWDSPATRDHAYLIRPQSFYNPLQDGARWTHNIEFDNIVGQTREVFYHATGPGSAILYAGTYRWIEVSELTSSEHGHIPPQLFKKLRYETLVDSPALSAQTKSKARNDISCHYRAGTAKLACVVLQCVGFNHALYEGLIRSRTLDKQLARANKLVEKLSNKRKLEVTSKPVKKAKI